MTKKKIRVWVHPKKGDDFYYEYKNLTDARKHRKRLTQSKKFYMVEPPIYAYKKGGKIYEAMISRVKRRKSRKLRM